MNNENIALVYKLIDASGELAAQGYTHTVVVCEREEWERYGNSACAMDLVDFKNEVAARVYADAFNMGLL